MAGLLKQLQKSKRASEHALTSVILPQEIQEDVVVKTNRDDVSGTKKIDRRFAEAEKLLEDLKAESAKPMSPVKPEHHAPEPAAPISDSGLKVVRRNRPAEKRTTKDESLPTWSKIEKRLTTQAEALLKIATDEMRFLLTDPDARDLEMLAKRAVQIAQERLAGDVHVNWKDGEIVEKELLSLADGKGPLLALFEDTFVSEIFIDSHASVKVRRRGQSIETPFGFRNGAELELFVQGMLRGQQLNAQTPIIDCVVDDKWHSRVNAIHGSVTNADEPRVCIRVPRQNKVSFYDLLQSKTLPATLAAWLAEVVVQGEANILVVGPSGSGKTMLATALVSEISSDERVITVEEIPEIFVATASLEKLVARPSAPDGTGGVTLAQLLQVGLRRNPQRFVVGEIREDEAKVFLRALESGYTGSIATIHGDFAEDALWRYLDILAVYERAPQVSLMRRLTRSVHLIIAVQKVEDRPAIVEVAEVLPLSGPNFSLQPLVRFDGTYDGKRIWRLMTQNSYWLDRTAEDGVGLRTGPGLLPADQPV